MESAKNSKEREREKKKTTPRALKNNNKNNPNSSARDTVLSWTVSVKRLVVEQLYSPPRATPSLASAALLCCIYYSLIIYQR